MTFRIVFMGTPAFATPTLQRLAAAGHQIVAVYTQPARPAGRGLADQKSAVQQVAEAAGFPVLTPRSLKAASEQNIFRSHGADVAVVVAYGMLLPPAILEIPRYGCLNLHASRLPRWRGAAPLHRAVMAGDGITAASVMRMGEGLDTGPVCLEVPIEIGPDTTTGELHHMVAGVGSEAVATALAALELGDLECRPQSLEGVSYARKIEKAETRIDFSRSAIDVHNLIRGLSPVPGAWFEATVGMKKERIKALRSTLAVGQGRPGETLDQNLAIACADGAVRVLELQRAGKRPLPAHEFLKGLELVPGTFVG